MAKDVQDTQRFYSDANGNYVGSIYGGDIPAGCIEVAAPPEPTIADIAKLEIAILENGFTPRLLRDATFNPTAIFNKDTGETALERYNSIESQIAAERAKLK